MPKHHISEFDVIMLTYDEPKKEEFWANLQNICPWAKRVDGVKGFDSAHKVAANLSETDYLVTVDGDNKVDMQFFDGEVEVSEDVVLSWSGRNIINGLIYGNGGLKLWPKSAILNMKSHENSEEEQHAVDFCWNINYKQLHNCYSDVYNNQSPYQAFRAAFREGVKMSLDRGLKVSPKMFKGSIHPKNYNRLLLWCSIGSDVDNGLWSIYGARLGTYLTNLSDWNIINIRDYEWFKDYWTNDITSKIKSDEDLRDEINHLGDELRKYLNIEIAEFTAEQSKFIKTAFSEHYKTNIMMTEEQINNFITGQI